jgi:hypothetical protein
MKRKQCHHVIDRIYKEGKKSRFAETDTNKIKQLLGKVDLHLNWKQSFEEYVLKQDWFLCSPTEQKEILGLIEGIEDFDYVRKTARDNHYDSYGGGEAAKKWFYDLVDFTITFRLFNVNFTAYHHVWYYSRDDGKTNFIDHGSQNHEFSLGISITARKSENVHEDSDDDEEVELKGPEKFLSHVKEHTCLKWPSLSRVIFGFIHHVILKNESSDPFQSRWGKDKHDNWVKDKDDVNLFDWTTEYNEKTVYEYWDYNF